MTSSGESSMMFKPWLVATDAWVGLSLDTMAFIFQCSKTYYSILNPETHLKIGHVSHETQIMPLWYRSSLKCIINPMWNMEKFRTSILSTTLFDQHRSPNLKFPTTKWWNYLLVSNISKDFQVSAPKLSPIPSPNLSVKPTRFERPIMFSQPAKV